MTPEQIAANLSTVRQKIADAAQQSGRTAAEVTLVGVTKYVDAESARWLVAAGCRHVQVDEPMMARRPQVALSHGIDHLEAEAFSLLY